MSREWKRVNFDGAIAQGSAGLVRNLSNQFT